MKRKLYSLLVAFSMLFATSCDMDLLDSPNDVTLNTANPTLILNQVQVSYAGMFNTLSVFGERVTRITSQPNVTYANAYTAQQFNGTWNTAYATILSDIKAIEAQHAANPVPRHMGIARVIRALTLMNLVDYLGDVPNNEALDAANFNQKLILPSLSIKQLLPTFSRLKQISLLRLLTCLMISSTLTMWLDGKN